MASALAAATPTSRAPIRPGPLVTAMASTSSTVMPASANAAFRVGTIASRCARLATSGTTPPKRACSSTLDATAWPSNSVPRTMPTPVSSQDDSIPRTIGAPAVRALPTGLLTASSSQPHGALKDEGVEASAVIPRAPRDLGEALRHVEADGGLVGCGDLQDHALCPRDPRLLDGPREKRGPDALPAGNGGDGDAGQIGHLSHDADGDVAHEATADVGNGDPTIRGAQLGLDGLDRPRPRTERLRFELGDRRGVVKARRTHLHVVRTVHARFGDADGVTSGRRR